MPLCGPRLECSPGMTHWRTGKRLGWIIKSGQAQGVGKQSSSLGKQLLLPNDQETGLKIQSLAAGEWKGSIPGAIRAPFKLYQVREWWSENRTSANFLPESQEDSCSQSGLPGVWDIVQSNLYITIKIGGAFNSVWTIQNLANLCRLAMTLELRSPPEDSGVVMLRDRMRKEVLLHNAIWEQQWWPTS